MIYYSLIYNRIQYGIVTWDTANKTVLQELHVKLNNIVRTITYSSRYCPVTCLYKLSNFLKSDGIYRLELAKSMYQLLHKKFKTALNDCFVDITNIHSHNTRTKRNLVYFKPRVQTSTGKKSLTYREIDLWGKIKPEVKEMSWVLFKKKDETKSNSKLQRIALTFSLLQIYKDVVYKPLLLLTLCNIFACPTSVEMNYCKQTDYHSIW